ncbi:FMN-linked oxidoreductase [Armillaria solidipes]|uniref:Dihydroorotate oxidase n=1 Tax=Armillaria solidipes TaxID=1076256 RepID=A0A2H3C2E6_9AGAR|nr:FMN-linked oxidoreductase [Armillaria solidipes]
MTKINTITVSPPLINTSCAWAGDFNQLEALYKCPFTGAVTTRTASLHGYKENENCAVAFSITSITTLNSYGYSPYPLSYYISWIETILKTPSPNPHKAFIISVTASTWPELESVIAAIQSLRTNIGDRQPGTGSRIAVELNTSCPNIPGSPPKGYIFDDLRELLNGLEMENRRDPTLTIGLKLPPYVYQQQFKDVLNVLADFSTATMGAGGVMKKRSPFAFLTCTNTLGNSLLYPDQVAHNESTSGSEFAVPTGLGGLAGEALHALSLGNVFTFHKLLHTDRPKEYDGLEKIVIIGVGGVTSKQAVERMNRAGAEVVGCATLLGKEGVKAFQILSKE